METPFGLFEYLFTTYPLIPSTTTSCPGTPPANSQRTKQFLQLFLSESEELPITAIASIKPPSLLLVGESYMTPSRTAMYVFTAIQIRDISEHEDGVSVASGQAGG
jgi:hypothetical protein